MTESLLALWDGTGYNDMSLSVSEGRSRNVVEMDETRWICRFIFSFESFHPGCFIFLGSHGSHDSSPVIQRMFTPSMIEEFSSFSTSRRFLVAVRKAAKARASLTVEVSYDLMQGLFSSSHTTWSRPEEKCQLGGPATESCLVHGKVEILETAGFWRRKWNQPSPVWGGGCGNGCHCHL